MKKTFISILSVAMFAACAKSEPEEIAPIVPEPEDEAQTVYVEIGVMTGSETKATYDADLHAYWEAGDQILAVQGCATASTSETLSGKDYTANAEKLNIENGENTNSGVFSGLLNVYNSTRYFHFAYPTSGVSLVTTTHTKGASGLSGTYSTYTTCTYTVPTEQDGKWTPFLCASTTEQTTAENITGIDFGTSLNACFAVRVFDNDKTTPKKIKSITITAESDIVGTMSATTANDGAFSADMFTCNGGGNTITADNLQNIETLGGLYEYRFEVLPVEAGVLTLTIADEAGSVITRKTSSKTFKANTRGGTNVYWDEADISMDATTWFEDSCKNGYESSLSSATTIYCDVSLFGIGADDIQEKGVIVNGAEYTNSDASNKFSSEIAALNGNGAYTVQAYAILNSGEKLETGIQTVYVVDEKVLPTIDEHTICSSYNLNAKVEKTNDINGDIIQAEVRLNDCWASNNLIESVTLVYDGFNASMTGDTNLAKSVETSVDLRAYKNTHIEVKFSNGYVISTPYYTINVTGIPYWWKNNNSGEEVRGSTNGATITGSCNIYTPSGLSDAQLDYDINIHSATIQTTGILTVNNVQIFSVKPSRRTDSRQTKTESMAVSTGEIEFSYNNSYGNPDTALTTGSHSKIYKVGIIY